MHEPGYSALAGAAHNAWDPTYDRGDVLSWLLQQQRR